MAGFISTCSWCTSAIEIGGIRFTFLCRCACDEQFRHSNWPSITAAYILDRCNFTSGSTRHRQPPRTVCALAMDSPTCDVATWGILSPQSFHLFEPTYHLDLPLHWTHASFLDVDLDPGLHISSEAQASHRYSLHSNTLLCARRDIPSTACRLAATTIYPSSHWN